MFNYEIMRCRYLGVKQTCNENLPMKDTTEQMTNNIRQAPAKKYRRPQASIFFEDSTWWGSVLRNVDHAYHAYRKKFVIIKNSSSNSSSLGVLLRKHIRFWRIVHRRQIWTGFVLLWRDEWWWHGTNGTTTSENSVRSSSNRAFGFCNLVLLAS